MANLIPPDAKKAITLQYWVRVVSVWLVLIAVACLLVALLKVPTYVLVRGQLQTYVGEYESARDTETTFTEAQAEISDANKLARLLAKQNQTLELSEVSMLLDEIAGTAVNITSFRFVQSEVQIETIEVTGVAATRASLAKFSDDLEAHPLFASAEVPLSNLVRDRDISFQISIIPEINPE